MDEEIKAMQEELKALHENLRNTQFRLQHVYNRLNQLQKKAPGQIPHLPTSASKITLENFIGLKLIHIVGIIVLVIGISIGVKYAIDRALITEGMRILLAYGAGALLYLISLRLRKKYTAFSAILFSGAMASLYFTTFAAHVYYSLISFAIAFLIMILLTVFTAYQALRYSRQEIALLGLVGAYGIPFLISKNTGNPALLFTYIAIINSAVVFLSYKKNWSLVAYTAQVITWLLLFGWTLTSYTSDYRTTALFFAAVFFIFFVAHALLSKILRQQSLLQVQAQQVVCNNLIFYGVLLSIFSHQPLGALPLVSTFLSLLAAAQALTLASFYPDEQWLKRMLLLVAVGALAVGIAQQWDGLVVTFLWLTVAIGLFVGGILRKVAWLRLASIILMGVTLLKLLLVDSIRFNTIQKIISYMSLGVLLLVVSFLYQKFKEKLFVREE